MGSYQSGGPTDCLSEKRSSYQNPSGFTVDDLLDLPNDDDTAVTYDGFFDNTTNYNTDHSSTFNSTTDSSNSSASGNAVGYQSFADSHFSCDLFVTYDDMVELDWLSNFVEDSFPTQQNSFHFLSGSNQPILESFSSDTYPYSEPITRNLNNPMFQSETPPGKARSKRSRTVPRDWSTRLLHLSPAAKTSRKKQEKPNPDPGADVVIRKCLHCASEKTPQWRTGPMGPKTLCNACGVRYKSGRLVPEYRPAASPTFVPTKHSNSHRKVLELRRQQELQRSPQEQCLSQRSIFGASNGGDDFLLHLHHHHHRGGVSFKHMI